VAEHPKFIDPASNIGAVPIETPEDATRRRASEASTASSLQGASSSAASSKMARAEFILKHGVAPEDVYVRKTAPGNTELTGEEYLATVDPATARTARMYIDGRRPFPTGAALRNPQVQLALDVATQADPELSFDNSMTRVATRKDFTSGLSARNITALNTAIGHLNSLKQEAAKLNNTWSPDLNRVVNSVQSDRLGDPRVNNFKVVARALSAELAKVFKGAGAPALTELKDWESSIDPNMSQAQFDGLVQGAAHLMQSRIEALGEQYKQGMGRSSEPLVMLNPKSQRMFDALAGMVPPEENRSGLFDKPLDGAAIVGKDVKGYRLQPEQEGALDDYLRSDQYTPEGYADMAAGFFKQQTGAEPDPATRDEIMSGSKQTHEFYKANPDAGPVGFDYGSVDKAATENAGLGTSVAQAVGNAPESAYNLATGVLAPATDAARSLAAGKREGVYEVVPNMVGDLFGAGTGTADAFGRALMEKYGSFAGVKRSAIRDPLVVASDVSIPLTLGGAGMARLPGMAGRVGAGVSAAGRAIDPLAAMVNGLPALTRKYTPAGAGQLANDVASEVIAFPSGVGGKTLQEAFAAGKSKGVAGAETPQSAAFTANMRGNAGAGSAVDVAREAVANLRDAATLRYNAAMQQFGRVPVPLSPGDLIRTVRNLKPKSYDALADAPNRPSDHLAWQQMNDTVEHYVGKAMQDPALLEPLAVDQFKQDLYTIGSKIGGATDRDAARIAGTTYRAVRKMLTDHDPVYANIMKDYGDAAQEAAALESGFSLTSGRGKPVNVDAASRKLLSIMRNNANTNYGRRAEQGARLADLDPTKTLMPTLAGQSASSWAPRGLRGNVEAAGLLGEAITKGGLLAIVNPKTLALLAPTSPRIMSELSYYGGQGAGAVQRLGAPVAKAASDLYSKYPTTALATSRADQYSDELDPEELKRRYGLGTIDMMSE